MVNFFFERCGGESYKRGAVSWERGTTGFTHPSFLCHSRLHFAKLVAGVLAAVPGVHLWAAGIYDVNTPAALRREALQLPLRSAPAVVREVAAGISNYTSTVLPYATSGAAAPTDGPAVAVVHHDTGAGHAGVLSPRDCRQCGEAVAAQLARLGVGSGGGLNTGLRPLDCLLCMAVMQTLD